jgi:hypothetical protein
VPQKILYFHVQFNTIESRFSLILSGNQADDNKEEIMADGITPPKAERPEGIKPDRPDEKSPEVKPPAYTL